MGIKYRVNEEFFKTWSRPSAYVLGFIFADGHLEDAPYIRGKYIRISSCDYLIIEQIKQKLNSAHKIVITPAAQNRKEKYLLRIGSHKLYKDLESFGLHPRKSHDIKFPKVPERFLSDFIRGYFDGDGTITFENVRHRPYNRLKVIFTSGSKDFLSSLANILATYRCGKLVRVYNSHRSYQVVYRSKDALCVLKFIYDRLNNKEVLFLQRKYNKYRQLILRPSTVRCSNIFDKSSKIWTYKTKRRRTQEV